VTVIGSWADTFSDHPVRTPDRQDPLVRAAGGIAQDPGSPHIAFACLWGAVPELTWSHTPWNLRTALRSMTQVTDVGLQVPPVVLAALKLASIRYRQGHLSRHWHASRLTAAYVDHALVRGLAREARGCDAALVMQDLAALPVPFYSYQDTSYDASIAATTGLKTYAAMRRISPSTLERLRERQRAIYEQATGIIAESHWFARSLVELSGVPAGKIHVVPPGITSGRRSQYAPGELPCERRPPRRRLLFIGRVPQRHDFHRKGGDLAVEALALLRRQYDPQITLTIAGPSYWPLAGNIPDGVKFLGPLESDKIVALYDNHDLLVMPSRLEPFGVVFAEALARGMPCVARDAFAMPEVITPGISGALVTSDSPDELAASIAGVLTDDALYDACRRRAPEIAAYFSWDRTALGIIHAIGHGPREASTPNQPATAVAPGVRSD
jgi:glycosyltransferase involved in cell wall biosynthesis